VFALVALNEAVLEEAVERHVARIDAASETCCTWRSSNGGHGQHHGPAEHPPGYVPTPAAGMVRPIATQSSPVTPREWRLLGAAAGIAVLTALIVLGGQAAFHKPAAGLTPNRRKRCNAPTSSKKPSRSWTQKSAPNCRPNCKISKTKPGQVCHWS
jgi:hypothetical protein